MQPTRLFRSTRSWRRVGTGVCLSLACAAPGTLLAAGAAPVLGADSHLHQGVDVGSFQGRYREALDLYTRAQGPDRTNALDLLNVLITQMEPVLAATPDAMNTFKSALELRAKLWAGERQNWENTAADYQKLLEVDPRHTLPLSESLRFLNKFEEVRKATVGSIVISVQPADAEVEIDKRRMEIGSEPIPLLAGAHTLTARRAGFADASESFQIVAGSASPTLSVALQRVSAVLKVLSKPPGVEIAIDGVQRGTTPGAPAPRAYEEFLAKFSVSPTELSAPLVISDIMPGKHVIEAVKDCYQKFREERTVEALEDYMWDPVILKRADASVQLMGESIGLVAFFNGEKIGNVPLSRTVCEGPLTVDVQGPYGRFVQRIDLRTGDSVSVTPRIRPAFALLSVTGGPKDVRGAADLRFQVERMVGDGGSVLLFAPPAELVAKALSDQKLDPGWLALDRSRTPIERAAEKMSPAARIDVSAHLADDMVAQGVATVAHVPKGTPGEVYVSLLASGSGEPDVLETDLDDRESRDLLVERLKETPALFQPSVGMLVVDVADRDEVRAVVLRVEPGRSAAAGGIAAGDVVVSADQKPVRSGAEFAAILAGRRAGDTMQVEVRNRAGALRGANLVVAATPRLVSLNDQTVLRNKLLLDFRSMLARQDLAPLGQSVARLNIGALLITLGNHAEARRELEQVTLADGPGVSGAAAKFLRGLCAEKAGQRAEAERLWAEAAAVKDAMLSEDGPLVADEVAKWRIK